MWPLIILKLPNSFIFFQHLGFGHLLKFYLGLSPSTLKIKILFNASRPDEPATDGEGRPGLTGPGNSGCEPQRTPK